MPSDDVCQTLRTCTGYRELGSNHAVVVIVVEIIFTCTCICMLSKQGRPVQYQTPFAHNSQSLPLLTQARMYPVHVHVHAVHKCSNSKRGLRPRFAV